jgi:hypothetical protein
MSDWEEVPLIRGGELRGRALVRGTEIHFEVIKGPAIFKQTARDFLAPLFDRLGFLTTRAELGDKVSDRFITRMGFERTWDDGKYQHYVMTALPFGQEK